MSEPRARAESVRRLMPGLSHWTVHDDRIDFRSEAYAVDLADGRVLVDPLPLAEEALAALTPVARIVMTGGFHQRSSWSFRRRLGVPVWAPRDATGLVESPDHEFDDGEPVGSELVALERRGPRQPHSVLLWRPRRGPVVLFCGDLLMRGDGGPFDLVPAEHHDDPAATRESLRDLLAVGAEALCPAHGEPALAGAGAEMRRVLAGD